MNNLIFSNNRNMPPPPPPGPPPPAPPCKEKKFDVDFHKLKKNTFKSLNEVECFLNNFHKLNNYIKLYKILK